MNTGQCDTSVLSNDASGVYAVVDKKKCSNCIDLSVTG